MHPRHALHYAFLNKPRTVQQMRRALPPNGVQVVDPDTSDAAEMIEGAQELRPRVGDVARLETGLYVFVGGDSCFFVEGILYGMSDPLGDLNPRWVDPDSPVALINRFTGQLTWGSSVLAIAADIAGRSLLGDAIGDQRLPSKDWSETFRDAPWGK